MKNKLKILAIPVFALLLMACEEPNVKIKKTEYVFNSSGHSFKIIELDSCQYFFFEGGHAMGLSHKGNCKFCINRIKK